MRLRPMTDRLTLQSGGAYGNFLTTLCPSLHVFEMWQLLFSLGS